MALRIGPHVLRRSGTMQEVRASNRFTQRVRSVKRLNGRFFEMPTIRGKFIAELEDGMPLRREFKVLIWLDLFSQRDWFSLEDLDRLRIYLRDGLGNDCIIRLFVSSDQTGLIAQAEML